MKTTTSADTWLYLCFVQLQLCHWQQQENLWDHAAVIVREQDQVIVQCNLTAQQAGVEVGMALSDAWLLADEIAFTYLDLALQHTLLIDIATQLYQHVADITIDENGTGLWVHVHTQRRLYGSERALKEALAPVLAEYDTIWAFATNPLCAKLGLDDRHAPVRVVAKGFDIGQTSLSPGLVHKLCSMGLRTLDKVLQVPASLLGKKLGEEIVTFYLRITGEMAQPMPSFHPPEGFYAARQLHAEVISWDGLRFVYRSLLQQLEQYLRSLQQATQCVEVILFNRHYLGNPQAPVKTQAEGMELIKVELARPVYRAEDIFPILQLKLEGVKFAAPVVDVALAVKKTEDFSVAAMSLTDTKHNNTELNVLLNRLQARLGEARVEVLQPHLAWLPELQQSLQSTSHAMQPLAQQIQGWRPLWLQAPQPIDITQWEVYGQPQRLSLPWWQFSSAVSYRDYMLGQDISGRWGWLYFAIERPPSVHAGCWYLHGWAS